MNIIYMPAGHTVWIDIAKKFKENNLHPKIWFGDPCHNYFAEKNFPDCETLDFSKTHLSVNLKNTIFDISEDILFTKAFFKLKDQVYKIMDRQDDLGIYNRLDREAFFYYLFCYFYNKINTSEIKLLIAAEGPHSPVSMVIYGVCKILKIPTYHLAQNSIVPLAHVAKDFYGAKLKNSNKLDSYDKNTFIKLVENYIDSIDEKIPTPLYMKIQGDNNKIFFRQDIKKYILSPIYRSLLKSYMGTNQSNTSDYSVYRSNFYKKNKPTLAHEIKTIAKKAVLKTEYDKVATNPNLNQDFVFVPLHYEPERTSNPDGGHFYNVYDMIVALRSYVPKNIKIILKEHPSQFNKIMYGHRGRSPLFYKSITTLPNIEFASIDISSDKLIRNCLFVASQTGTATLEAAIIGKKGLLFGTPWFLGTPNLYKYNDIPFNELLEKNIYPRSDVKESIINYIKYYTLPVCINPSAYRYYKTKYPDEIDGLLDNTQFAEDFVSIVLSDFYSQ